MYQFRFPLGFVGDNLRNIARDIRSEMREKDLERLQEVFAYRSIHSVERRLLAGDPVTVSEAEEAARLWDEKPPLPLSKKDLKLVRTWMARSLYRLRIRQEWERDWKVR